MTIDLRNLTDQEREAVLASAFLLSTVDAPVAIWWCEPHQSGLASMAPDPIDESVCWTFHHESNIRCELVPYLLVPLDAVVVRRDPRLKSS